MATGFAAGRAGRPVSPPLIIERGTQSFTVPAGDSSPSPADVTAGQTGATAPVVEPRYGADGTEGERPTDPAETISVCGARTKKGTPCSRRVRGTGRCWQHVGKSAILPASKLIVQGQGK